MKTPYEHTLDAFAERDDHCVRCARPVAEAQARYYEDGGPGECRCGEALPLPDDEWLAANGYELPDDDEDDDEQVQRVTTEGAGQ